MTFFKNLIEKLNNCGHKGIHKIKFKQFMNK